MDGTLKKVHKLETIANELGVPLSQLALAWCASNANVSSVITGATKESQVIPAYAMVCSINLVFFFSISTVFLHAAVSSWFYCFISKIVATVC